MTASAISASALTASTLQTYANATVGRNLFVSGGTITYYFSGTVGGLGNRFTIQGTGRTINSGPATFLIFNTNPDCAYTVSTRVTARESGSNNFASFEIISPFNHSGSTLIISGGNNYVSQFKTLGSLGANHRVSAKQIQIGVTGSSNPMYWNFVSEVDEITGN